MSKAPFTDGVPELLILRLLTRKEMYGYELVSQIHTISTGVLTFGEGCVYPILHRLVKEKRLSSRKDAVDGRVRRYYKITKKGRARLKELETSWSDISQAVSAFDGGL